MYILNVYYKYRQYNVTNPALLKAREWANEKVAPLFMTVLVDIEKNVKFDF